MKHHHIRHNTAALIALLLALQTVNGFSAQPEDMTQYRISRKIMGLKEEQRFTTPTPPLASFGKIPAGSKMPVDNQTPTTPTTATTSEAQPPEIKPEIKNNTTIETLSEPIAKPIRLSLPPQAKINERLSKVNPQSKPQQPNQEILVDSPPLKNKPVSTRTATTTVSQSPTTPKTAIQPPTITPAHPPTSTTATASTTPISQPAENNTSEIKPTGSPAIEISLAHRKLALKHLNRASQFGMKGQFKAAVQEYNKALALNPRLPDAHVGISAVYGGLGKWPQAIDALKTALSTPNDFAQPVNLANAKYNLSASYCMNNQGSEAYGVYQEVLEMKHPNAKNLGKLLEKKCPVTKQ